MPTRLTPLHQARQQLFTRQVVEHPEVDPRLLRSWQRCLAAGLHPVSDPCQAMLPKRALHQILAHQQPLLIQARPLLESLFAQVRPSGSMVILADSQGVVLETLGDHGFAHKAQRVALCAGASWGEQQRGTNAIGTALIDHASIQIHGAEHFLERNTFLTCAAAPIIGAQGQLVGVLDISGDARHPHPHTLGLVNWAATLLENRLLYSQPLPCVQLHPQVSGLDSPAEGLLLIDEDGRLIGANRTVLGWLNRHFSDLGQCHWTDHFPADALATLLHTPAPQLLYTHHGATFFARLRPPIGSFITKMPTISPPVSTHPRDALSQLDSGDPRWRQAADKARRIVGKDIPLLLLGESGVGKELFARALHAISPQATGPFVAINCGALPEHLIEAELFGYVGGAFTGARREGNQGRLREANGGTLFLDEIGDMPLSLQTRLLRVLQERQVTPLGGGKSIPVQFSLIAATHQHLLDAIERGHFRTDLYYRINGLSLYLPALRERNDFAQLVQRLLHQFAPQRTISLKADVFHALTTYSWPGNLRQLANALRTAVAMLTTTESVIEWTHLPDDLNIAVHACPHSPTLAQTTEDTIEQVITACHGNVSAAARRLGISRQTLYRKLANRTKP